MSDSNQTVVCFQCGQAVGDPPALNELDGGAPCPACAERLLESLPSLLPPSFRAVGESSDEFADDAEASLANVEGEPPARA